MATAEPASRPHERQMRKRPFAWMRRLANLKSSSSDSPSTSKKSHNTAPAKDKKALAKNNPYPESGHFNGPANGNVSFNSPVGPRSMAESFTSAEDAGRRQMQAKSIKSTAPTVTTQPDTVHSGRSKAETGTTNMAGAGSTFSSPNHSERSLTTTLTTIQSGAPSHVLGPHTHANTAPNGVSTGTPHSYQASPPPSALPPHLAPHMHPNSYQAATANNILTDNASILTLASSSKRRRRNSLDTNASVRALAPSSVWGGSRESLPLSVLSGPAESNTIYTPQNRTVGGFANAERASVYSSSGVAAPALTSERNSYYKNADGVSVRSGLLGHGRTDSISGSVGPAAASPLASPREPVAPGRLHRRSEEWRERDGDTEVDLREGVEDVKGKERAKD